MRLKCTYKIFLFVVVTAFMSVNTIAQVERDTVEYGHTWSFSDEFNTLYSWELSQVYEHKPLRVIKEEKSSSSFEFKFEERGLYKLKVWFVHSFVGGLDCPSDAYIYEIFVKDPPQFDYKIKEGSDLAYCLNDSIVLHADVFGKTKIDVVNKEDFTYEWINSSGDIVSSSDSLIVKNIGDYSLQLEHKYSGAITKYKSFFVDEYPLPEVDLGEDLVYAPSIDIYAEDLYGEDITKKYQWSIQDLDPYSYKPRGKLVPKIGETKYRIAVNKIGDYELAVTDENGCTGRDIVRVNLWENIGIPTAFSPNNDGKNDVLKVLGSIEKIVPGNFSLIIYNRDGLKLWESKNPSDSWDGTYNGKPQSVDGYVYFLTVEFTDGQKLRKKGAVSLLR